MHAQAGDWLEVEQSVLGKEPERGLIEEVRSSDGSPPYVVRWEDADHTALVYPGPDAIIRTAAEVEALNSARAEQVSHLQEELARRQHADG
ncbi:DUF1918 domain-containing protein [Gordonia sp. HNM0687]|uniref:DUF1918 domain-containing protein n=2 Tax=Gordonia mangrovi TaxID=2665643 RepID=A0A6L7GQ33_9ACTN|nr:DUF1918 domain-containing protein [Gordonia mangrovi]